MLELAFEPIDLLHLAHDHKFVAVAADRAVVVEAVGELRVAADHVGRLGDGARHRVVDAAALAAGFRSRDIHDLFLGVVHQAHALGHALADDDAGSQRAIHVEDFDPVVIDQPGLLGLGLRRPRRGGRRATA